MSHFAFTQQFLYIFSQRLEKLHTGSTNLSQLKEVFERDQPHSQPRSNLYLYLNSVYDVL